MPRKSRVRRTAEEARALILDAAEAQLRERGPDGLRLQDLAREVGVSHPAILHHFGSRTGLVQAVIARTTEHMQQQILAALAREFDPAAGATLIDGVFRVLGDRGMARTLAWLCLASETPPTDLMATYVRTLAEAVHRVRRERHPEAEPSFEDTLFTVTLAAMAPIGNAIAGEALRASAGLDDDPDAERRFVSWFAALIRRHLESGC